MRQALCQHKSSLVLEDNSAGPGSGVSVLLRLVRGDFHPFAASIEDLDVRVTLWDNAAGEESVVPATVAMLSMGVYRLSTTFPYASILSVRVRHRGAESVWTVSIPVGSIAPDPMLRRTIGALA